MNKENLRRLPRVDRLLKYDGDQELYAASAYLSQEPILMGPLKAQDLLKIIIVIYIVACVITLSLFGWDGLAQLIHTEI